MDNKSTTKRMIGAVVLVLIAALLLAWLLKGKNKSVQDQQELIAQQTDDASPILGFPGVKKEGEGNDEGAYVIGATDGKQDPNAQQQAQNALQSGQDKLADAGNAVAETAGDAASGVAAVASNAVDGVKKAAGEVADNFQVRDDGEKRPIVENGEVKAGTGSMGSNEVSTAQQASDGDSGTTAGGATDGTETGQATQQAAETGNGAATDDNQQNTQQTSTAGSGSGTGSGSDGGSAQSTQQVANPTLANEKPVPAPRSQSSSASSSNSSTGSSNANSQSASASSSGGQDSSAAAGSSGYAIQVLAASNRNTAERVRKSIAVDGYPTFVVKARVNGKTVYRVRVGTYPARGAARSVQNKMKARYKQNQYVQNSFVTKN